MDASPDASLAPPPKVGDNPHPSFMLGDAVMSIGSYSKFSTSEWWVAMACRAIVWGILLMSVMSLLLVLIQYHDVQTEAESGRVKVDSRDGTLHYHTSLVDEISAYPYLHLVLFVMAVLIIFLLQIFIPALRPSLTKMLTTSERALLQKIKHRVPLTETDHAMLSYWVFKAVPPNMPFTKGVISEDLQNFFTAMSHQKVLTAHPTELLKNYLEFHAIPFRVANTVCTFPPPTSAMITTTSDATAIVAAATAVPAVPAVPAIPAIPASTTAVSAPPAITAPIATRLSAAIPLESDFHAGDGSGAGAGVSFPSLSFGDAMAFLVPPGRRTYRRRRSLAPT